MERLTQIHESLTRLTTPYKDIYTSVFFLRVGEKCIIFDAASFPEDADAYIFPAMRELGISEDSISHIFISHPHRDHIGALDVLSARLPQASIVASSPKLEEKYADKILSPKDGEILLGALRVVSIPGHTAQSMGLLDTRTGTLLTGDSLQFYGIFGSGNWGGCISFLPQHFKALESLSAMEINCIAASHDYHPLGDTLTGKMQVQEGLLLCRKALDGIRDTVAENMKMSDEAIAALYNAKSLPTLSTASAARFREYILSGEI